MIYSDIYLYLISIFQFKSDSILILSTSVKADIYSDIRACVGDPSILFSRESILVFI